MKNWISFPVLAAILIFSAFNVYGERQEEAIERLITDHARTLTGFPEKRDVDAILKFYSDDYIGVNDGEWEPLAALKKKFSDLKHDMENGVPVGIDYRVSNIKVNISGNIAWATYEFWAKLHQGFLKRETLKGKCTGIYKVKGAQWVTGHLHCSTP